jgi:uncharacterized protein (DUF58 family)
MLPKELIKAVKRLEIVARRAVNDQLAGQYQSVFKGRGIDFADVREYQPGDDIRVIDWNVSARMDDLFVKQFVEERELTVFLLVDASASLGFGTIGKRKRETAAELAALLAFSAIKNNDRVGLLTFTDQVESFMPPKKGRKHVLRVITEVLDLSAKGRRTDIAAALEYLSRITRKKAVVFLVSDFMDDEYARALDIANRRHELIPLVVNDPMEQKLPNMGLVHFEDPETGELVVVDTSHAEVRETYDRAMLARRNKRDRMFRRLRIEPIQVETGSDYVEPLVKYFQSRKRRA